MTKFETADGTVLVKGTLRGKQRPDYGSAGPREFFEWDSSEKINAKEISLLQTASPCAKAKYISFGKGEALRMPLVLSGKGYGLGIAAKENRFAL